MNTVISKDGTTIAYDVQGDGPALIYITGATCFRNFQPVISDVKEFSKEFTVYNYDRRGRGDSGDTSSYTIDREIEDIEVLIDAAGGKARIYGHSSGAVLALEAALKLRQKVEKVVIYDASYVHDNVEQQSYNALAQKVKQLLDNRKNAKALKLFLGEIGMPRPLIWVLPLFPGWKTMKALAPTLMYDIELTKDLPPLERLKHCVVPVHIAVGAKNPTGLHVVADQLAKTIPGASYEKVEGQDHMVSAKAMLPILSKHLS